MAREDVNQGLQAKALELKEKLTRAVREWGNNLVDTFVSGKPGLKPVSVYLKRGLNNAMTRFDGKVQESVDNVMMFIGDENGNYDMKSVFDDLIQMFKEMDETPVKLGMLDATVGKGVIKINIPDNVFASLLFGKAGAIKITESDIIELKDMFLNE